VRTTRLVFGKYWKPGTSHGGGGEGGKGISRSCEGKGVHFLSRPETKSRLSIPFQDGERGRGHLSYQLGSHTFYEPGEGGSGEDKEGEGQRVFLSCRGKGEGEGMFYCPPKKPQVGEVGTDTTEQG